MARFNLDEILAQTLIVNQCNVWQRAKSKAGYGQIWDGEKVIYVHRLVAQMAHGTPSLGEEVLHSCDVRACCNPAHLSWGTRKDNMRDASNKKRLQGRNHVSGESHPQAKLTWEQVKNVRASRENGSTLKELAITYQVSVAAIHNIVKGKVRTNG